MPQETSPRNIAFFVFLAGAAAGALATLFTSSKGAWGPFKGADEDPYPESGQDLRGKAAGVWQDVKDRAEAMSDARQNPGHLASE